MLEKRDGHPEKEHLATMRRRKAHGIRGLILDLAKDANREDFAVCTYPVLRHVNELLETLANANQEGNTREILRQVRNTIMDGGWQKYRDPKVRQRVAEIFDTLATAEEILPEQVEKVFDDLHQLGLNPVGAFAFVAAEETDGKDEISD